MRELRGIGYWLVGVVLGIDSDRVDLLVGRCYHFNKASLAPSAYVWLGATNELVCNSLPISHVKEEEVTLWPQGRPPDRVRVRVRMRVGFVQRIRAVRVSSQGPRPAMRLLCTALRV